MKSDKLREAFFDFFITKGHKQIPSAPMIVKDDPSLMFTNAGMNQFKGVFLGDKTPKDLKIVNSQKCLRVSGKHNDLEEVGHDGHHHTMFEMLGNWSFGDYFKAEAIDWAWEFLTKICKLDQERIYITIFEGEASQQLDRDAESYNIWKKYISKDRIINGNKKDNFWEMGDTGPCGPCTEVHYDNRSQDERKTLPGGDLVNKDHPQVIEIWNLVFICFNRLSNGTLEALSNKHVDTGMGLERLSMIMQNKDSNYDTDVFESIIGKIVKITNIEYGSDTESDIAIRVIADHLRAVSFSIADGQLPSNIKAGYVIRRILRRAIRYGYSFLGMKNSFIYKLVPVLVSEMSEYYPEIEAQNQFIQDVIKEEEEAFLRTLSGGLKQIDEILASGGKNISGKQVFELYDTFGFPNDLTALILEENGVTYNQEEFNIEMQKQKNRSKSAAQVKTGDWNVVLEDEKQEFIGYDTLETKIKISRYREITIKNQTLYQLVFNLTPFYPEGGGQIGDVGVISSADENIDIIDTKKENNLIIHFAKKLPSNLESEFLAQVNLENRQNICCNHTATHLLHQALREILGVHVEQKGSLVSSSYLRFDFSHFSKVDKEDLKKVERYIDKKILQNIPLQEDNIPLTKAKEMGAMMLFGEKYEDVVRLIQFGGSKELCGGTHVSHTGELGLFRIVSESSVSAGIRRIEAITADKALKAIEEQDSLLSHIQQIVKEQDILQAINNLVSSNKEKDKKLAALRNEEIISIKSKLLDHVIKVNNIGFIAQEVDLSAEEMKNICFDLKQNEKNLVLVLASVKENKVLLSLFVSTDLVDSGLDASSIIKESSKAIKGSGGGQPFFATAGGINPKGIKEAFSIIKQLLSK
ncbi:MAG: alanine--tRNA ligase [Bacteroidota bacterium]|nr:alanine--tRNA ligase [Bacteroidota bacterium]